MPTTHDQLPDTSPRSIRWCATAAALGLLTWCGWFSWDTRTYFDRHGHQSGPYETWQVVGCVVTLVVVLATVQAAGADRLLSSLATCGAFTVGFCITAARAGTSGDANLFLVGAMFVFTGTSLGAGLISVVTWALARRASRRR